jgi:hypothetical protein
MKITFTEGKKPLNLKVFSECLESIIFIYLAAFDLLIDIKKENLFFKVKLHILLNFYFVIRIFKLHFKTLKHIYNFFLNRTLHFLKCKDLMYAISREDPVKVQKIGFSQIFYLFILFLISSFSEIFHFFA